LPNWERVRPYVATGLFSLVVALLVAAVVGSQLDTWSKALIAGYLWDSTLQKATTGNIALAGQKASAKNRQARGRACGARASSVQALDVDNAEGVKSGPV
jgi:hypothetical protein